MKTIPVRVPEDIQDKLKAIALEQNVSVSSIVREMIESFCNDVGVWKEKE